MRMKIEEKKMKRSNQ